MVVCVCKRDPVDIEKEQMLVSLLFYYEKRDRCGSGGGSRSFILIRCFSCNGRFSLVLSELQCCVVRSFECHSYSGNQKVSFACSFCTSSQLRSDIWIWFEESFAESVKPSGRNPLSYPILESKLPTIRLKEQTSLNSLFASDSSSILDMAFSLLQAADVHLRCVQHGLKYPLASQLFQ